VLKENSIEGKLPRHLDTRKNWVNTKGGNIVNKPLLALAYTRERFLFQRPYGNTNYASEVHLTSGWETIKFLPTAIKLSVLEPLPTRSIVGGRARRLLFTAVQLEMFLVYVSLLFLLFSGRKSWSPSVFVCIALALPFLISLGVAVPNVGTINRYRFPFLILIKIAGLAALWNASRLRWPGRLLKWVDPPQNNRAKKKVLFLVPDDITFLIQRLVMAQGAQKAGYDVHVASEDTGVTEKVRELGFTFHRLDLNRGGLNPIADFAAFIRLVFLLARVRPDILHNVSIKPVIYGSTAGTIVGLKRIVCLVNGLGYAFQAKGLKGKFVIRVAKALYHNALALPGIRVIFQNPDDQDYFVTEQLVDANKTILIRGSGVNTKKFPPTPQPQNPKPVVLFVGRLLKSKGVDDLINAAKILKEEKIDFILRIVGEPDERNPEALPKDYIEELHKYDVIEWMGRQTDMPKFYREADLIVLPQQNREGLPLTLLEASSSARAIIATDVPGCREVVRHNVNGLLVPPKNPIELAKALKILIQDAELRKKFGEKGAEIVEKEFSAEIVQKQLSAVYESLLNDSVGLRDNHLHA
nr:glycosyltransferase family 4 protein [Bdellovibrionales bacterium]